MPPETIDDLRRRPTITDYALFAYAYLYRREAGVGVAYLVDLPTLADAARAPSTSFLAKPWLLICQPLTPSTEPEPVPSVPPGAPVVEIPSPMHGRARYCIAGPSAGVGQLADATRSAPGFGKSTLALLTSRATTRSLIRSSSFLVPVELAPYAPASPYDNELPQYPAPLHRIGVVTPELVDAFPRCALVPSPHTRHPRPRPRLATRTLHVRPLLSTPVLRLQVDVGVLTPSCSRDAELSLLPPLFSTPRPRLATPTRARAVMPKIFAAFPRRVPRMNVWGQRGRRWCLGRAAGTSSRALRRLLEARHLRPFATLHPAPPPPQAHTLQSPIASGRGRRSARALRHLRILSTPARAPASMPTLRSQAGVGVILPELFAVWERVEHARLLFFPRTRTAPRPPRARGRRHAGSPRRVPKKGAGGPPVDKLLERPGSPIAVLGEQSGSEVRPFPSSSTVASPVELREALRKEGAGVIYDKAGKTWWW
ncbi:hypothetical protein C8R44DRAFT_865578 [Mycena epipterygia]|nr:hypothetical protein C8R44DRAFT_865578 [Mycena epipterygia]